MIRSDSSGVAVPVPRRADPPSAHARMYLHTLHGGSISPAAVSAIAAAITRQEGNAPGSISNRNNNPGNLVYAGQAGASPGGAGGFAQFSTPAAGQAALEAQITLDATRGTDITGRPTTTIAELINSWAPSSDPRNNTPAYVASVGIQTGYDVDAPLSSLGAPDSGGTVVAASDTSGDTTDTTGDDGSDGGGLPGASALPVVAAFIGVAAFLFLR
jgi:hypothetical protein